MSKWVPGIIKLYIKARIKLGRKKKIQKQHERHRSQGTLRVQEAI